MRRCCLGPTATGYRRCAGLRRGGKPLCPGGPVSGGRVGQGVNYDSVFVPEEPKRVVTASGKVIETETELLQKKIERKKTETAQKSEAAPVTEEIRVEEPVVEKEYEFPPTNL